MKRATFVVVTCVASAALTIALAMGASPARAQERAPARGKQDQGVLTVGEITIVGRVQKPIAAVDVAKIQPKLTLAELRQPFLDRIEEALHKDPF
jgi:hypothetical protein